MKNSKNLLLIVATMVTTIQGTTENLSGRTQNLNIVQFNKHTQLKFSAGINDTNNILRDLACNCDNPDFEFVTQLTVKPFAMANELEAVENIANNPVLMAIVMVAYQEAKAAETEKNIDNFVDNNLKELLYAPGQDGKSSLDILEEKQSTGKVGCVALKSVFEEIKECLGQREDEKKQKAIEAELERTQQ